jgi:hypothetical protein
MAPASSLTLSLDQLADGGGDPVLVVDFVQFSTTQQLSDDLGRHGGGHPVYRIDPVTDLAREPGYRPLDALADGYAEVCLARGLAGGRLAVVGHCSAAPLSLCLADRLAGRAEVSSVLVQPTWPDEEMIGTDFGSFRAELGAAAGPVPDLVDPDLALAQMTVVLRDDLRAMALRYGLDPASAALGDMLARYRAWLGFLLAGSAAPHRPWGSGQVVPLPAPDGAGRIDGMLAGRVLSRAWPGDDRSS